VFTGESPSDLRFGVSPARIPRMRGCSLAIRYTMHSAMGVCQVPGGLRWKSDGGVLPLLFHPCPWTPRLAVLGSISGPRRGQAAAPTSTALYRSTGRWGPSGADLRGTSHFSAQVWDCSAGGGSSGAGRDRRWGKLTRPSARSTEASPIQSGRFGVSAGCLARARAALAGTRLSWRLWPPPGAAGTRSWRAGEPAPRWRAELPVIPRCPQGPCPRAPGRW
jgi:hypothetical protein